MNEVTTRREELDRLLGEGPIVLFDGHCSLCAGGVQFVLKRDPEGLFRFAALESELGLELKERFDIPPELDSMVLLDEGRARLRSTAALEVLRRLETPWRWVAVFRFLPAFLRDAVYRLIARCRHRIFGRPESCYVPPPEERARFLDL